MRKIKFYAWLFDGDILANKGVVFTGNRKVFYKVYHNKGYGIAFFDIFYTLKDVDSYKI